jgi:hypothetical protein
MVLFKKGSAICGLGASAFMECTSLESFEILASISDIGGSCFSDCERLS